MRKNIAVLLAGMLLITGLSSVMAQTNAHDVVITVDGITLIALDDTVQVDLAIEAPGTPGDAPAVNPASDVSKELFYTVLVPSAQKASISVSAVGTVPAGLTLTVAVAAPAGKGTSGNQVLSGTDPAGGAVVTDIGSCHTTTGAGSGAAITYSLQIADEALLEPNPGATLTLTYTIAN